jgi:hypothetical protein
MDCNWYRRAALMIMLLVSLSIIAKHFYPSAAEEGYTSAEDKQKMVENVAILRNSVIAEKLRLMQMVSKLETLVQDTIVIETSDFVVPEKSSQQIEDTHALDCSEVQKMDVPASNEQMSELYSEFVIYMTNIKTFKSNMFLMIAQLRAKINLLQPDLSTDIVEDSTTPTNDSLDRAESRSQNLEEIVKMVASIKEMLDSMFDNFRQLTRTARHMRCVNARIDDLIRGSEKKEDVILYKLVMSV